MKKALTTCFFGIASISLFFSLMIFSFNVKDKNSSETKEIEKICKVIFTLDKDNKTIDKTIEQGTCHE